ncbi:GPO family capsid scaffolding protein [Sphingomonas hylomeconis]|nr:GPO family capsid scaffolding protein [Sphingomonas hylomeconis]
MAKSKFFRAFVAGATISDGRVIEPEWIDQVVETFNVDTYSPRINIEHISGYSPEPPFNGYGTVVAVEARDVDITIAGTTEKRRALYCQVEGNDQLVALAKADQKPFPSAELTPSYAGTNKIGLIGLAFTDKPASIGTEKLQFSRSAPGTVFAPGADAASIEFEAAPVEPTGIAAAIVAGFASVATLFSRAEPEKKVDPAPEPKTPANDNFDIAAFSTAIGAQVAAAVKPGNDAMAAFETRFAALETKLAGTEQLGFSRAPASGGAGTPMTDC